MLRLLFATLLLLGALLPRAAQAYDFKIKGRELNLAVTESFLYTYHAYTGDADLSDDKYHQFTNVLDVSLGHRDFRLGARFDLNLFADTPAQRLCGAQNLSWCGNRYLNNFVPERVYATVARPEFDVTLGDFYVSLGKGIALNIIKIDQLGQDTTLRGGKFHLHYRDLEAIFLGGQVNPLDTDEATGMRARWRQEPILGGRLEYRILDKVIVGVHAIYNVTEDPNSQGTNVARTDSNTVVGAGIDVPSLWDGLLGLSTEVDLQRTISSSQVTLGPDAEGDRPTGVAAYASATLHWRSLTALAELKYYDGYRLAAASPNDAPYSLVYSQPPTLERDGNEVADNTSVGGGRLRLDYNFGELRGVELLAFVNYGYFHNWAAASHEIHDPFGGLELQWGEGKGHLNVGAGVRREFNRDRDQIYRQDIHAELDAEQSLGGRHSLKLGANYQRREARDTFNDYNWNEADVSLSYKWSPSLALGVSYERQDDPRIVSGREGNDDPTKGPLRDAPVLGAANYLSGTAQWFFTSGTYVAVRAGGNRPGVKCINGVCRYYPGFTGVQVSVVGRF